MSQNAYRHIIGTEGHADYLVVGNKQGMVIAVKAICDSALPISPICQLGVRIRATKDESTEVASIPHMVASAFPGIEWTKQADTHCSLVMSMKGNLPETSQEVIDIVSKQVMPKISSVLAQVVGPYCNEVSWEDVQKWLSEQFSEKAPKMYQVANSLGTPIVDKSIPSTSGEKALPPSDPAEQPNADVVDFFAAQAKLPNSDKEDDTPETE